MPLPQKIPDPLILISDIHANQEALEAVYAAIDWRETKEVWCLGDIVGYGPCPVECLKLIHDTCSFVLMGNHDYAVLHGPLDFNLPATTAIECHVKLLEEWNRGSPWNAMEYIRNLPLSHKLADTTFVHSSPRDPLWEYLFVGKEYEKPERLEGVFDFIKRLCFCGHTHHPGWVFRAADGQFTSQRAQGSEYRVKLPADKKAYLNIGSVGQPRDGDPRACYVELRGNEAIFHRIEYDYHKTMVRLSKLPIHPRCAERLALGK